MFFIGGCKQNSLAEKSTEEFIQHLDEKITRLMSRYEIPGVSIALVANSEIIWSNAYGFSNIENSQKMTTDTICRTESITKSITAWGVLKLVEQELIDLDVPVLNYIESFTFPNQSYEIDKVTTRQLLSHSSGMPLGSFDHYGLNEDLPTLTENLSQKAKLINKPGSVFFYSNVGYHVLELLIEEVTKAKFVDYITNEVLLPLGMISSTFAWNQEDSFPMGYDINGKEVEPYIYPAKSSGGLLANVNDIAKFIIAGTETNTVLSPESVDMIYTPTIETKGIYKYVSDGYGFGHFIDYLPSGKKTVFSGGQGHGWMSQFHLIPEDKSGIVILTNSQKSWPFFSYIINDWSIWSSNSSVKMGIISSSIKYLITLISIIFILSLYQMFKVFRDLKRAKRTLAPFLKNNRALRIVEFLLFCLIVFTLLWCLSQDYLEIASIYPVEHKWLGYSLFLYSISILLLSLFPHKSDYK